MIYLDNAATTKVLPEVKQAISSALDIYGNPSSQHDIGKQTSDILERCRKEVLDYLGVGKGNIVFTSSGSEANNLALQGWYFANKDRNPLILASKIEHKSVLKTCDFLQSLGCAVVYLDVGKFGNIDYEELEGICEYCLKTRRTFLVSIQGANNEIGTIHNVPEVIRMVHKYGGAVHSDMVQLFPQVRKSVLQKWTNNIDMMTVSGHKFGCPKGIGFLYIRDGVKINPLVYGGNQENGLRAGTENLPYIFGLKIALKELGFKNEHTHVLQRIETVRNNLLHELSEIPDLQFNGSPICKLSNNINVSFKGVDGMDLATLLNEKGICVSTGSACNSGVNEPSHVLNAIGVSDDYINGTIRLTVGDDLSESDMKYVSKTVKECVKMLRCCSNG